MHIRLGLASREGRNTDLACRCAGADGGNNFLYDNYNAEMITKRSAQMYCQTGAPSFPVVEATITSAHEVKSSQRS